MPSTCRLCNSHRLHQINSFISSLSFTRERGWQVFSAAPKISKIFTGWGGGLGAFRCSLKQATFLPISSKSFPPPKCAHEKTNTASGLHFLPNLIPTPFLSVQLALGVLLLFETLTLMPLSWLSMHPRAARVSFDCSSLQTQRRAHGVRMGPRQPSRAGPRNQELDFPFKAPPLPELDLQNNRTPETQASLTSKDSCGPCDSSLSLSLGSAVTLTSERFPLTAPRHITKCPPSVASLSV